MSKPMPKQRRYQITPNSVNPTEEASVKSIMDKLRNRAAPPDGAETAERSSNDREIVHFPSDSQIVASHTSAVKIAADSHIGEPHNVRYDSPASIDGLPTLESVDSHDSALGQPRSDSSDSPLAFFGSPRETNVDSHVFDIGKPPVEQKAIKISPANNPATTGNSETATNKNVASHKSGKTRDWATLNKNRKTDSIFIRADADLINEVKHFNVDRGLAMRDFFELAARHLIDDSSKPQKGSKASNISSDVDGLMMLWKTDKRIINLYLGYSMVFNPGIRWKAGDDKIASQFNEIDIRVIELGIMETQVNKLQSDPECRINSFKFYTFQIEGYLAFKEGKMLDAMLEINRRRWKQITGKEVDKRFLEEDADIAN